MSWEIKYGLGMIHQHLDNGLSLVILQNSCGATRGSRSAELSDPIM